MACMLALIDGRPVPLEQAGIPLTDSATSHGLAVYETLEVGPDTDPGENLERLAHSAQFCGISMPPDALLRSEIEAVRAAVGHEAWIRITLTGDHHRYVWAVPVDPSRRFAAVRCARGPHLDHPLLPGWVKHRSRAAWMAAVRKQGVDELLLVDADGRFTEGTSCAVVAVVGEALWTASWDGRILCSTTLSRLLGHARALGIEVVRQGARAVGPWQGLYVASTTRRLAPVEELDGAALPTWDPIGSALAQADGRPR
jgi:branched-subunit amino acid aminotransferase/4-amino-4-deoxychorismate lyase